MSLSRNVANRLAQLRKQCDETQADVADVIGCTGGHISNIENNKAELSTSELERLAAHFKVHSLYLFAGLGSDVTELLDTLLKMDFPKRKLALRLFKLNLDLMEVSKNWLSDAVNKS